MTARDRQDSRRSAINERHACIYTERIRELIEVHQRQARVKRINAGQESDPIARATLLGNADTHDVAAARLQRVLRGEAGE